MGREEAALHPCPAPLMGQAAGAHSHGRNPAAKSLMESWDLSKERTQGKGPRGRQCACKRNGFSPQSQWAAGQPPACPGARCYTAPAPAAPRPPSVAPSRSCRTGSPSWRPDFWKLLRWPDVGERRKTTPLKNHVLHPSICYIPSLHMISPKLRKRHSGGSGPHWPSGAEHTHVWTHVKTDTRVAEGRPAEWQQVRWNAENCVRMAGAEQRERVQFCLPWEGKDMEEATGRRATEERERGKRRLRERNGMRWGWVRGEAQSVWGKRGGNKGMTAEGGFGCRTFMSAINNHWRASTSG